MSTSFWFATAILLLLLILLMPIFCGSIGGALGCVTAIIIDCCVLFLAFNCLIAYCTRTFSISCNSNCANIFLYTYYILFSFHFFFIVFVFYFFLLVSLFFVVSSHCLCKKKGAVPDLNSNSYTTKQKQKKDARKQRK